MDITTNNLKSKVFSKQYFPLYVMYKKKESYVITKIIIYVFMIYILLKKLCRLQNSSVMKIT